MKTKNCKICNKEFLQSKPRMFCCSDVCKKIHYDKVNKIRNKNNFIKYGCENVFQ